MSELFKTLEKDILKKRVQTGPLERRVDHETLNRSLVGLSCPEHYIEVVLKDRRLLSEFPLALFPAVRVILGTDIYTLARVYPGNEIMTPGQRDFLETFYLNDWDFVDYTVKDAQEEG
jgi:hypothetical protein